MPFALRRLLLIVTALCLCATIIRLAGREPIGMVWLPVAPSLGVAYVPSAHNGPTTSAWAAIVYENTTKTVLYAKNEHAIRAPASLTKIMTALLVLENGRMDDIVTVSPQAARVSGSSAHVRPGQKFRSKICSTAFFFLRAMMRPSQLQSTSPLFAGLRRNDESPRR